MRNRRVFRMLLNLFLLLGILTNGVMSEACLCTEPCLVGLQGEMRLILITDDQRISLFECSVPSAPLWQNGTEHFANRKN